MPAAAVISCSSKTKKAGLQFPVGRPLCMLKKGNYVPRTVAGSAVLEYLATEIVELAGNAGGLQSAKTKILIPALSPPGELILVSGGCQRGLKLILLNS